MRQSRVLRDISQTIRRQGIRNRGSVRLSDKPECASTSVFLALQLLLQDHDCEFGYGSESSSCFAGSLCQQRQRRRLRNGVIGSRGTSTHIFMAAIAAAQALVGPGFWSSTVESTGGSESIHPPESLSQNSLLEVISSSVQ